MADMNEIIVNVDDEDFPSHGSILKETLVDEKIVE